MRESDVPILEQQNLTESIGVQVVFPEKEHEEIPIPTTVPQVENEFGPDVYVVTSVPPLKEEEKPKVIKGLPLLSHYDEDQEVKGRNPHKIPDPNLVKLIGQALPGHRRHRSF